MARHVETTSRMSGVVAHYFAIFHTYYYYTYIHIWYGRVGGWLVSWLKSWRYGAHIDYPFLRRTRVHAKLVALHKDLGPFDEEQDSFIHMTRFARKVFGLKFKIMSFSESKSFFWDP